MKTNPALFRRVAGFVAALFLGGLAARAQQFTGYDIVVPATPTTVRTVIDGASLTLPSTRSFVIGIEGGTRGPILFLNLTGTAQYPIVIVNKHGSGRVVVSDVGTGSYYKRDAITLNHCKYVQLRGDNDPAYRYGIETKSSIASGGTRGVHVTGRSSYVEVMFLEIHDSGFAGIMAKQDPLCSGTGDLSWSWYPNLVWNDIKIHDNYVHDTGGEGFYIGFTAWETLQCSGTVYGHEINGLRIYNNLVERGGWDGIQIGSSRTDVEVYNNVIVDSGVINGTQPGNTGLGVQIGAGTTGLFYNNVVLNSRGNGINLTGVGGNILYNNLVDHATIGVFVDNRPAPPPTDPNARQTVPGSAFLLYNNTVANTSSYAFRFLSEVTTNELKNNVGIIPGTQSYVTWGTGSSPVQAGNIFQRDATNMGFVDAANYDYRIAGASNALNVGVTLSQVIADFQGIPRPQGVAYDSGYSEAGALSTLLVCAPPTVGNNNGTINASTIGGTAPYTYAWSTGATTASIGGLAPGLYKVTVTDSVGAKTEKATYLFAGAEMGAPVSVTPQNQVLAPTFSPAPGTYTTAQTVTIASATAGASIRYTLDGSTPTSTTGNLYSAPVALSSTGTFKAIAFKAGMTDSTISTGAYFIGTAPTSPPTGVSASAADRRVDLTWNAIAGVNRYEIKRATTSGGPYAIVSSVTTNSFGDEWGLSNGTPYYYVVTAVNEYGSSGNSAQVSATPVAYPAPIGIIKPYDSYANGGWGPTTVAGVSGGAAGAFDDVFAGNVTWDAVNQTPVGQAAAPHTNTSTATPNAFWFVDFGPDYSRVHITEMWTRYRPSSPYSFNGFASMWWDDDKDNVNDGVTATGMNFQTAQYVEGDLTVQFWIRDRDFGATPVVPQNRYLIIATPGVLMDRQNEFAFVGWVDAPPTITTQPQSQGVVESQSVTLTVAATGTPTPTYQWRKNGVNIAGATATSYTINNAQVSDAADYSVVVTNSAGSVTSANATLAVYPITIISPGYTNGQPNWGQATGSGFCSAAGAFEEQPTWDKVAGAPSGLSATPHSKTITSYANCFWYVDFGANYANIRITQMWTRYRPNSPGNMPGFASMWWDDDKDTTNDGVTASTMNFQTAQNVPNIGTQQWIRDRDFGISTPITPQGRYLVISTGATTTDRPNEFAFVGYVIP